MRSVIPLYGSGYPFRICNNQALRRIIISCPSYKIKIIFTFIVNFSNYLVCGIPNIKILLNTAYFQQNLIFFAFDKYIEYRVLFGI